MMFLALACYILKFYILHDGGGATREMSIPFTDETLMRCIERVDCNY